VERTRHEAFDLNQASEFDAIAKIAVRRSMPRFTPTPDRISSHSLRTCSCRLSTAALNGAWQRSGIRLGAVGYERWLDRSADLKTMAAALPDCPLITAPGIGRSMNPVSPSPDILSYGLARFPEVK